MGAAAPVAVDAVVGRLAISAASVGLLVSSPPVLLFVEATTATAAASSSSGVVAAPFDVDAGVMAAPAGGGVASSS